MSVKIMSLVWQCPDLQNQCRLLLMLAIADHCNDDGNCYPSKASLMAKARMKERTFVNAKHWLIDHGFLQIDYCEGATTGAGKTNLYQINLKRLQWSASSAAHQTNGLQVLQPHGLQDLQPLSPQWSATSAALNRQLRESSKRTVSRDEASSSSPDFALAIEESDSSVTTKERTKSKERFNGSRNGIEAIPKTLLKNGSRPPRARQDKPVDPGFIQALKDNSPGIEVEDEIRKMRRWLLDRPGRKLTRKFAIAWINRIKPENADRVADQRPKRMPPEVACARNA